MKQLWLAIAGVCILIAAVFIWWRDFSTAFIVAVIGVVAWFLNYRSQIKSLHAGPENELDGDPELDETDEQV